MCPAGIAIVEIRDDLDVDYGIQVMPGVNVHYAERDGKRIPVFVEVEVAEGPVEFERGRKE